MNGLASIAGDAPGLYPGEVRSIRARGSQYANVAETVVARTFAPVSPDVTGSRRRSGQSAATNSTGMGPKSGSTPQVETSSPPAPNPTRGRAASVILLTLVVLGCTPDAPSDVAITSQCEFDQTARADAHKCLVECARAGNPMSDEEGEDLVAQCDASCSSIYCARSFRYSDGNGWRDCRRGLLAVFEQACRDAGWKP